MRKTLIFLAAVTSVATLAAGCGTVQPYAAKVNGVAITVRQLDDELDAIKSNKKYLDSIEQQLAQTGGRARGTGKDTFDTSFVDRVLTRQILLEIIHQGFVKRKLSLSADDKKSAEDQLKQSFGQDVAIYNAFSRSYRDLLVRRNAEVDALQNALSGNDITAEAIKQFYDQNKDQFSQTCARHILAQLPQDHTPTAAEDAAAKAKADGWKARLDKGEDFAAIAKAESDDKGSGAQGGDLGCLAKGNLVAPFETAEDGLQVNQISAPVKTSFGYHVIQVTGRKTVSLEEATPQIRQQLQQSNANAINEFLDKAVGAAKISVNPRYGHFDKNSQQPGVVPPDLPPTTTTTAAGDNPLGPVGSDTSGSSAGSGQPAPQQQSPQQPSSGG